MMNPFYEIEHHRSMTSGTFMGNYIIKSIRNYELLVTYQKRTPCITSSLGIFDKNILGYMIQDTTEASSELLLQNIKINQNIQQRFQTVE